MGGWVGWEGWGGRGGWEGGRVGGWRGLFEVVTIWEEDVAVAGCPVVRWSHVEGVLQIRFGGQETL